MRALYLKQHGGLDQVGFGEVPEVRPGAGEVVVGVKAAALNRLDLFVLGGIPGVNLAMPHVPGADGAGVITDVGEGVTGWEAGDEVVINPGIWCGQCEFCRRGDESLCVRFGLLGEHRPGTFGERVAVPAASLGRRPSHLTWAEAAAFPLVYLTAWRMLMTRSALRHGETVLIHGIGGGVSLAALDIAKARGARVIVTSGSASKLDRARRHGADAALDYTTQDVAREVRAFTGKRGADIVVDSTGAATWMVSLKSAARGGRIVTCGATTGPNPAEEIRLIFWNQLSILGSTMGNLADWNDMLAFVAESRVRPVVDSVFALEAGRAAYERMDRKAQFGKIVLAVSSDVPVTGGQRSE